MCFDLEDVIMILVVVKIREEGLEVGLVLVEVLELEENFEWLKWRS